MADGSALDSTGSIGKIKSVSAGIFKSAILNVCRSGSKIEHSAKSASIAYERSVKCSLPSGYGYSSPVARDGRRCSTVVIGISAVGIVLKRRKDRRICFSAVDREGAGNSKFSTCKKFYNSASVHRERSSRGNS